MEVYKLRELDYLAIEASGDPASLNQLIEQCELYIIKTVSTVTHRYISKSDDEWSIALIAFVQAVRSYDLEKGSFLSFAKLVMKRRLVDYIRSQSKHSLEICVDPISFDIDHEDNETEVSLQLAIADKVSHEDQSPIQLEIITINEVFLNYGFTFFDLTRCSPHAKKTKKSCAMAVAYVLNNSLITNELKRSKQLPLKIIEKNTKVPRKILERHRKYIIAAIEILSGEYPSLAEYLQFIREEMK